MQAACKLEPPETPHSDLLRWAFRRPSGRLTETVIDDRGDEFPRINGRHSGQPYRYVYTAHWGDDVAFGPAMKHDMQRQTTDLSDVVILDARDFNGEPVATIRLPVRVPFGFHGGGAPDRMTVVE